MNRIRVCVKPRDSARIDLLHIFQCRVKFFLGECSRSLPEQLFEFDLLELLVKILFEMFHTESVMAVREYALHTFKETFLAILQKYETVFRFLLGKKFWCIGFDDFIKKAEKP